MWKVGLLSFPIYYEEAVPEMAERLLNHKQAMTTSWFASCHTA